MYRISSLNKKDCWNNICSHNLNGCPDIGLESTGSGTPIEQFNKTVSSRSLVTVNFKTDVLYIKNVPAGATITIVNSAGATLNSISAAEQNTKIPVTSLGSGFYFCVVKMKDSAVETIICHLRQIIKT